MASSSADENVELCSNEEETNSLARSSSFNLSSDMASMLISSEQTRALPDTPPDAQDNFDDRSIEEAKTRVAERFFLKKSKRFCRPRLTSSRQTAAPPEKSRIKSFMTSFKDSVKTTLANSLPKTKTLSNMTNTLVTTLKHPKLSDCLKYLGLVSGDRGIKRKRDYESEPSRNKVHCKQIRKTVVVDGRKLASFLKPRVYDCSDCKRSFFNAKAYLKHIKRHARFIRCACCYKVFGHVVHKRRHELQCVKRAIL